jgi:hypothetical protein
MVSSSFFQPASDLSDQSEKIASVTLKLCQKNAFFKKLRDFSAFFHFFSLSGVDFL